MKRESTLWLHDERKIVKDSLSFCKTSVIDRADKTLISVQRQDDEVARNRNINEIITVGNR